MQDGDRGIATRAYTHVTRLQHQATTYRHRDCPEVVSRDLSLFGRLP